MADQIIFNVGLKMEILQSSISELQKVLNNLEPNSRGFKDLGRVISSMTDDLSKLQKASNNGFINETQINQAGKVIDRIEDRLNNAQQIIRSLSFRDIQLDNSQLQVFNDLQDQLRAIEAQFNAVKEQAKQGLLSDANTRDFLSGPVMSMVNDLDKDFDTIAAKVEMLNRLLLIKLELPQI